MPSRRQVGEGFAAWETVRVIEARRRRAEEETRQARRAADMTGAAPEQDPGDLDQARGRRLSRDTSSVRSRTVSTPASRRRRQRERERAQSRARSTIRGEGETWASRTEEEGSLIIACCDQTVKFFEVWAGKSKGRRGDKGLGSRPGVLGGSRILEGWCERIGELGGAYREGRWSEEAESIR